MFYWNPWAFTGIIAFFVGWALAVVVLLTAPHRDQNRYLALFLALISTGFGIGVGWMFAADGAQTSLALQAVSLMGFYGAGPAYLLFLSTLPTRTMAWLRPRWVRVMLLAGVVASPVVVAIYFDRIVAGIIAVPYARFDSYWTPLGTRIFEVQAITTATLGIVAAIGAWIESPRDSPLRRQARWYAATFIVWEILQLTAFTLLEIAFRSSEPSIGLYTAAAGVIFPAASLLLLVMLGYGILRHQLFDIDLRIKFALRKSTVAAIFIATFFVVSELGVAFFEDRTQSQVLGILSTGLLVFAIAPLQRFAERFSDTAMPGVRNDAAYLDAKKLEVYQAALEEAVEEDGTITRTQTGYLARLRKRLEISDRDHALLQQAIVNARRAHSREPTHGPGSMILGRYRIARELGKGAHGTTYLAHDEQLDRNVVLKALPAHGEDPERILREARATCQLNHPHIVTIYDIERIGDDIYIVMEHVDGGSLADRLEQGPLTEPLFGQVAIDLVQALEHVHAKEGVHRDVKPANVLLTDDGRAKLADFGIASLPGHEITVDLASAEGAIGTVRYMSPEQAKGQLVDHRSDLYSAAVTLYEASTGQAYVERRRGESAIETQMRVARSAGPTTVQLDAIANASLVPWFERALAHAAEDRFTSAAAMRTALDTTGRTSPK